MYFGSVLLSRRSECNGRLIRFAISMAVQLLGSLPFEVKVGHLHLMCSEQMRAEEHLSLCAGGSAKLHYMFFNSDFRKGVVRLLQVFMFACTACCLSL